jgi:hypothetical protein
LERFGKTVFVEAMLVKLIAAATVLTIATGSRQRLRSAEPVSMLATSDAEHFLKSIFEKLHSSDPEREFLDNDGDDQRFAKVYGEGANALRAEGYGEVQLAGLQEMIKGATGSFIDLGSGLGRSVFFACMSCGFSQCEGVELSKDRNDRALAALSQVKTKYPEVAEKVSLIQGDLLKDDSYFMKNVIFVNNLLMPDFVQDAMTKKFTNLSPPGTVLLVSRALPIEAKVAKKETVMEGVTWRSDKDTFFRYTKN